MSAQDPTPRQAELPTDPAPPGPRDSRSRPAAVVGFGLRAAVLASLVVTGATATGPQGISDDPVRLVSGTSTTCCPPDAQL